MAKAKAKAKAKSGSGSGRSGRDLGGSGVTAVSLPPTFISGCKIRDGLYMVVFKRGEEDEPQAAKVNVRNVQARIDAGQGNVEELQWLLDSCQCGDLEDE
ncbi:hypothetical protein CMI37_18275 [Candidatus Pacearchaeota archaeon]|nr:hypothetical protein [Candidatus Pacearchaeota archaeon]